MTRELNQKLINTWDWLISYYLCKQDDSDFTHGKHAFCIIQIDDFVSHRDAWGIEKTKEVLEEVEDIMSAYALEDTLIARYNDSTYVVVLHFLDNYDEIMDMCVEIQESINEAFLGGETPLTVSIGASSRHQDNALSYEAAMNNALLALNSAQSPGGISINYM